MTMGEIELELIDKNRPKVDEENFIQIASIWMNTEGEIKLRRLKEITEEQFKEILIGVIDAPNEKISKAGGWGNVK